MLLRVFILLFLETCASAFKDTWRDVVKQINVKNLRENLKKVTVVPHIAAQAEDRKQAKWLEETWKSYGVDSVTRSTYNFLLSLPDQNNPNKIYLIDENNKQVWESNHKETVCEKRDYPMAYNAFAPKGEVVGELVYVNHGTGEDFNELKAMGISLKGKIAIARLRSIFRGDIVQNSEKAGAVGVILYLDPKQVAMEGMEAKDVFPNTIFMPPSAIESGSIYKGDSDPLSPGWPSIMNAHRINVSEAIGIPGIPSQPISYGDAMVLLEKMGGKEVPEEWKGLLNITYRIGPGFDEKNKGLKVKLVVNNYLKDVTDSNVFGIIKGKTEPGRYVYFGNHRDAWGFGALDNASGTSLLTELVRIMGNMLKQGWRPRRSIVFASWCVEEFMIGGSKEFVYENIHTLSTRAVASINMDICVEGSVHRTEVSPQLQNVVIQAMKDIDSPTSPGKSLFQQALEHHNLNPAEQVKDTFHLLSASSDHAGFSFYGGVPAIHSTFSINKTRYPSLGTYPAYHTGLDSFYYYDKLMDPGYKFLRACGQVQSHLILNLAESELLPIKLGDLIRVIHKSFEDMEANNMSMVLDSHGLSKEFMEVRNTFNLFALEVKRFELGISKLIGEKNDLRIREINDKLMMMDRVFINPTGLPGRVMQRHMIFSPAQHNLYAAATFPGISDLLYKIDELDEEDKENRRNELRRHLSDLMIMFTRAKTWLDMD